MNKKLRLIGSCASVRPYYLLFSIFLLLCLTYGLGCSSHETRASTAAGLSSPYTVVLKPPRNVLLVTIDTLRSDHLGCYGYSNIKTPVIDSLARDGVKFEQAFTPVPITLPSHASIFTSLYPITHGVLNNGEYRLSPGIKTLAQILHEHRFTTAAFVGAFVLSKQFGLARGFDFYDDELRDINQSNQEAFSLYNERRGEKVTESAIAWLKKNSHQRFFLWVHYFDPHTPYDPSDPFKTEYLTHPYDGEIAYTDYCLGELLQELEKQNLLKNTLIVFTSDHGESLGEHKENTHGIFLYEATTRVPLIFCYQDLPKGERIDLPQVKTLDIMPTILDILKIPSPPDLQGESLLGRIYHPELPLKEETNIFLETRFPEANFGWSRLRALRTEEWKYIEAPRHELYYLKADPKELSNVLTQYPEKVRLMQENLQKFLKSLPQSQEKAITMDQITKERLQSLGYVRTVTDFDSSSSLSSLFTQDPKDMIEVLNLFDLGSELYVAGQYEEAISSFNQVMEKNPGNILARFLLASSMEKTGHLEEALKKFQEVALQDTSFINVHNNLGNLYEKMGEYEKALVEYQTDIQLHPDSPLSYNNLGVIYLKRNNYQEAKDQFERALSLHPDLPTRVVGHTNLGIAYEMLGRYDHALLEYESSLKIDPNYVSAHMGKGNIYLKTKQPELAIQAWQEAIAINPENIEAHFNLGCLSFSQKKLDEAIYHLKEAIRLEPNLWQARKLLDKITLEQDPNSGL